MGSFSSQVEANSRESSEVEVCHIEHRLPPKVALLSCGDLFEDFFGTIDVSFEKFRLEQTGGWMFNYIDALKTAHVETTLIFVSEKVSQPWRFKHEPTSVPVSILPSTWLHRIYKKLVATLHLPKKSFINSLYSYLVLPHKLLEQELKLQNCTAILFQDYENPSFDVCVHLGRKLAIPTFASFQGGSRPRCKLEYPIRSRTLSNCSGVIIGSRTEANRVRQQYQLSAQKIGHIFNPLDIKNWTPLDRLKTREELGIPLHARVAISHGRIDIEHKGLDLLLEAWQQICRDRPDQELRLLLVGTGSDANALKQLIEAAGLSNIIWINEYVRDRTAIRRYLSAADVYVLASRYEGFPVAPIEAMGCHLPVVAANASGISDILELGEESGGIVVPIEDTTALAVALGQVIDNESWRKELGQRARSRAEQHFSLEAIGQQMYDFMFNDA